MLDVLAVGGPDVHDRTRPALRPVAGDQDVPVGHEMERPVERTQRGDPQAQALDAAGDPARGRLHVDVVTDAELVLEQDEEPREGVFHDRLRAESEGDAHHAGAREQWRDVRLQLAERHEDREHPDHHDEGGRQRAGQRSRALEVQLLRDARRPLELLPEPVHDQPRGERDQNRCGQDDDDPHPRLAEPVGHALGGLRDQGIHGPQCNRAGSPASTTRARSAVAGGRSEALRFASMSTPEALGRSYPRQYYETLVEASPTAIVACDPELIVSPGIRPPSACSATRLPRRSDGTSTTWWPPTSPSERKLSRSTTGCSPNRPTSSRAARGKTVPSSTS